MTYLFRLLRGALVLAGLLSLWAPGASAQFGPGGGGPGGGNQERAIVAQFDADKDGRLNTVERRAAQEFLTQPGNAGRGGGGGRGGGKRSPVGAGARLTPAE